MGTQLESVKPFVPERKVKILLSHTKYKKLQHYITHL